MTACAAEAITHDQTSFDRAMKQKLKALLKLVHMYMRVSYHTEQPSTDLCHASGACHWNCLHNKLGKQTHRWRFTGHFLLDSGQAPSQKHAWTLQPS